MQNSISILTSSGRSLNLIGAGHGYPLMLLHGFPLDTRMWKNQLGSLSSSYQCIAPEFRGFGQSSSESGGYSLGDLAEDIEYVRSHMAHEQQIVLCGLSMGGYVALEYWSRYPQHLAGLILSNTNPFADPPETVQNRLKTADLAKSQGTWAATEPMIPKLLSEHTLTSAPDVVDSVKAMLQATPPSAIANAQQAMAKRQDFSPRLSQITTPTLVVTSELDALAPPEQTKQWAAELPNSSVEIIPGAGHLPPLEAPQAFDKAVIGFLTKVYSEPDPSR